MDGHLEQSSVTGSVMISDAKDATMSHVTAFSNPVMMKKSTTVLQVSYVVSNCSKKFFLPKSFTVHLSCPQDAYPVRPKAMYMINVPGIMENLMTLFRSLLNDKMKERFNVHSTGDFSILHDSVGKDVLPEEYGGTNGTLKDHNGKFLHLEVHKLEHS